MLDIELESELGHKIELRLEKVDVLFLVVHELFEKVARDVVAHRVAVRRRLLIELPRRYFGGEIAIEHLAHVLSDVQRIEDLHIGKSVEENDARNDLVRMLHLL